MTTKSEIQALLRFLAQDARVPLPMAMSKVKQLQSADLTSSDSLAKSSITVIERIFADPKIAKQILSAAKRVTKKRVREPGEDPSSSPAKRKKTISPEDATTPAAIEESLKLPESNADEEELAKTILHTNRAPLVLAFAIKLLELTMPSQPLSSRLSLAQAVVSVNARTKALSLGIEKGTSAEDDGWGQGHPIVRVMGRDVRVMKRWGYDWNGKSDQEGNIEIENSDVVDSQSTLKQESETSDEPALWGLDLEALRRFNGPLISGGQNAQSTNGSGLPIYTAQSARAYLLKSFASVLSTADDASPPSKKSAPVLKAEKERNLGLLLRALDLLFQSWALLSRDELDKRAWAWYVAVRPEVETGVAGWGGKGEVRLAQILDLRRKG